MRGAFDATLGAAAGAPRTERLVEQERTGSAGGLHVGLLAPPWMPVPPLEYGGTEAVVDQLARGLTRHGCAVTLFTTGDSTCPVGRSWYLERSGAQINDSAVELLHVQEGYDAFRGVDVVHDHTVLGPLWATVPGARRPGSPPMVATLHGRCTREARRLFGTVATSVDLVAISEAQRRSAPEVPVRAVIHHGIDVDSFPMGDGGGGYVLFLGRMNPDKGVHRAIAAARAAGRKLLIAAKMRERAERRYFCERVEPLLGPDAVYLGEVGHEQKLELLAGAEALLNPIRWPEPFGLVMVEALACGTPVLTHDEGAAPEIVRHGTTGYLCADGAELVERLDQVDRLSRDACRADAAERFSTPRMVQEYIEVYLDVIGRAGAVTAPGAVRGTGIVAGTSATSRSTTQEAMT